MEGWGNRSRQVLLFFLRGKEEVCFTFVIRRHHPGEIEGRRERRERLTAGRSGPGPQGRGEVEDVDMYLRKYL